MSANTRTPRGRVAKALPRAPSSRLRRPLTVIYGWARNFGLVRFDGVRAVPWLPPDGEHLPSNWINALLVARDGTLWIATEKGLASWKDGKLTEYPEAAGHVVTSLLQDAEGTLWFGVRDSGRLCAVRVAKTQCYGAGSFGWSVPALYEDHKRNLWASAQTGLWRWAPGPPKQYPLPGGPVEARALIEGDNGVLLMATGRSGPFLRMMLLHCGCPPPAGSCALIGAICRRGPRTQNKDPSHYF